MGELRDYPRFSQVVADGVEQLDLAIGLAAGVDGGGGEVCHQPFQAYVTGISNYAENLGGGGAGTQAAHT